MPASPYAAVTDAVRQAQRNVEELPAAFDRARAYGDLLRVLQDNVVAVTAERDQTLAALLTEPDQMSNRDLAGQLWMTRQRVDQLAAHVLAAVVRAERGGAAGRRQRTSRHRRR